jgi:hypothetical protein
VELDAWGAGWWSDEDQFVSRIVPDLFLELSDSGAEGLFRCEELLQRARHGDDHVERVAVSIFGQRVEVDWTNPVAGTTVHEFVGYGMRQTVHVDVERAAVIGVFPLMPIDLLVDVQPTIRDVPDLPHPKVRLGEPGAAEIAALAAVEVVTAIILVDGRVDPLVVPDAPDGGAQLTFQSSYFLLAHCRKSINHDGLFSVSSCSHGGAWLFTDQARPGFEYYNIKLK